MAVSDLSFAEAADHSISNFATAWALAPNHGKRRMAMAVDPRDPRDPYDATTTRTTTDSTLGRTQTGFDSTTAYGDTAVTPHHRRGSTWGWGIGALVLLGLIALFAFDWGGDVATTSSTTNPPASATAPARPTTPPATPSTPATPPAKQ
jgi:hypothetical protein